VAQHFSFRNSFLHLLCLSAFLGSGPSWANTAPSLALSLAPSLAPDWSRDATIPKTGRENPYGWDAAQFAEKVRAGRIHALQYPITVTGLLIPAKPALRALDSKPGDPLFFFLKTLLSIDSDFQNFKGFWSWLGLHDYPDSDGEIPYPNGTKPEYPMGVSLLNRNGAQGMTLSCAACHSAQLFGKPILGMTNRFPRANLFFIHGQSAITKVNASVFSEITEATRAEKAMYAETRDRVESIGLKRPSALGLDTSLAQVALSLSKRAPTEWAERDPKSIKHPRSNLLDGMVADSKPAVWWNVKYKTHWLSDGSVVSGNPVFTNFLWNEIGRGVDLRPLVNWLQEQSAIVEELTTAVFATQAPKWTDYLSESSIDLNRAKRGEATFTANCAHCHGTYEKAWSMPPSSHRPTDTVRVTYFETTKAISVGTDPGRSMGMRALAEGLNPLAFSKQFGIVIEEQKGYVAPPLEGIFARFPYFHNNSIPNLCALMTPPEARPETYYSGEVRDPDHDFDQDCVGYPTGLKTQKKWLHSADAELHHFDSRKPGLSNVGHYERIFRTPEGVERYTPEQKRELIEFLKTL